MSVVSYFYQLQIWAKMVEVAVESGKNYCNFEQSYKNIQIDKEATFNQFLEKRDTLKNRLFQV